MTNPFIKNFELRNDHYILAYFPGDPTLMEPNYSSMRALQAGCDKVQFVDPSGSLITKYLTWCLAEQAAKEGTLVPARKYLMFRVFDTFTDPALCPMSTMVAYHVQHKDEEVSLAQQFLNCVLGISEQPTQVTQEEAHDTDWAQNIFGATHTHPQHSSQPAPTVEETKDADA